MGKPVILRRHVELLRISPEYSSGSSTGIEPFRVGIRNVNIKTRWFSSLLLLKGTSPLLW